MIAMQAVDGSYKSHSYYSAKVINNSNWLQQPIDLQRAPCAGHGVGRHDFCSKQRSIDQ